MTFITVLISFVLQSFDVTVVTCDAAWLDDEQFRQILEVEISEIAEVDRAGMILTVDTCTETAARLRVAARLGQLERIVHYRRHPRRSPPANHCTGARRACPRSGRRAQTEWGTAIDAERDSPVYAEDTGDGEPGS